MTIPPPYTITSEMLEFISKIDANRMLLASYDIPSIVREKLQRVSLLKSSLFSARIEGNPLSLDEFNHTSDRQKKKEIVNIVSALAWIDKNVYPKTHVTKQLMLRLHKMAMAGLAASGSFRTEQSAIFNLAGVAVYMPPPPSQINELMNQLLTYIQTNQERFPLITAFVAHLIFEKIHPFLDGNGRVGRLLILAILKSKGYDFGFAVPFEEYLDEHKDDYYYHLNNGWRETSEYLTFMVRSFYEETELVKKTIHQEIHKGTEVLLLPPRQEELYLIIKDHRMVSFDFLKRRFLKVPARTLRYDLKKLQDSGYVVKIGGTKGALYTVK